MKLLSFFLLLLHSSLYAYYALQFTLSHSPCISFKWLCTKELGGNFFFSSEQNLITLCVTIIPSDMSHSSRLGFLLSWFHYLSHVYFILSFHTGLNTAILNLFYTAIKHFYSTPMYRTRVCHTTNKYLFYTPLYRGTTEVKISKEASFAWKTYVLRALLSTNEIQASARGMANRQLALIT